MVVVADDADQLLAVLNTLEGNLTGSIYSAASGADDDAYEAVAEILRPKVGRLINDKMPTGVAVSPAQNHGGPYPATSQSHFTAVGIPASLAVGVVAILLAMPAMGDFLLVIVQEALEAVPRLVLR